MKLRNKVTLIIALAWLVLFALVYLSSETIIQKRFITLEKETGYQNISRIDRAINVQLQTLNTTSQEWAHAEMTYDAIMNSDKVAPPNLHESNFSENNFNAFFALSSAGSTLYGKYYDSKTKTFISPPCDFISQISSPTFIEKTLKTGNLQGLLKLTDKLLFVTANIIKQPSSENSPSILVFSRDINGKTLSEIVHTTQLQFYLYPSIQVSIPEGEEVHLEFDKKGNLIGYRYLYDVFGNRASIIKMIYPATIYEDAKTSIQFYLTLLLAYGLIISLLFWMLIEKFVLSRIASLTQQVTEVAKNNAFTTKIKITGDDELNVMSNEINNMLSILAGAHKKELNENKKQLDFMLNHDANTGLPNKLFFNSHLQKLIRNAEYAPTKFSVGLLNINNFHYVHDSFSQEKSDEALKEIANRLKTALKQADMIARFAGDKFIFYFQDITSKNQALLFCKSLLETLNNPININNQNVHLKANMGIVTFPDDAKDLEDIHGKLGLALKAAEKSGQNQAAIYSTELKHTSKKRVSLDADLHAALINKEFELYYQPKINIKTFKMMGAEALIRWKHPKHGMISPDTFIPVAEESGLINEIGAWVFEHGCKICKTLTDKKIKNVSIAVNVSGVQFYGNEFVNNVGAILQKYKFPPHLLQIELTESAVVEDVDFTIIRLKELASLGIKISIDDFGTGYSSMNYLKNFPIHYMKIDKCFVDGIPADRNNTAIVDAIITLGKSLQLEIVAEGVEKFSQYAYLLQNKCDIIQGYLFSKPIAEDKFLALIDQFQSDELKEIEFWKSKLE